MPYAKKSNYRGRKGRGRGRGNRKNRKSNLLADKKINTLVERRMQQIAKKEDLKQKQRLIYRQYLFGPYDRTTNVFQGGLTLDFLGIVCPLAQIQLQDNATMQAVVPAINPVQNPQTYVPPGANVIAPAVASDGFRRSTWISIHGISLEIRSVSRMLAAITGIPRFENATVSYKIITTMYPDSDLTDARPDLEDVGNLSPLFGYTPKLDLIDWEETKDFKVRTHFSGKFTHNFSTLKTDVKFRKHYINLSKKPIKVEYVAAEQNGRRVTRWKPFLILQCDIPSGQPQDVYKPLIHACTKLYYTDA